jgi:hypothetical protein
LRDPSARLVNRLEAGRWLFARTARIAVRTLADVACFPAGQIARPRAAAASSRRAAIRVAGSVELAALGALRRLRERGRRLAVRALTLPRDAAVMALTIPVAILDLTLVNRVYLAISRRTYVVPDKPAYFWDDIDEAA